MKTVLAGIAFSISALLLWGFTVSRETGEAANGSQTGTVHTDRKTAPKRSTAAADPRGPVTRSRASATSRLSQFPSTEQDSLEDPASPRKRPSTSSIVPHSEGPRLSGHQRPPREEREDLSFATSHKRRNQPAGSHPLLQKNAKLAIQVPAITPAATDVVPSATPSSGMTSPVPYPAADEDFRYRQIYGQHAWMARHIRMHNGLQDDEADQ